ncbi:hypothetical protein CXG81DRAFT_28351 [Caulochytrium protostelioides]|uniref:Uncharacterized protein n=1 Tax=Caulochytrium protostelioides TaxID=1555241 RepID=A0A4P9X2L0_9FUNG|nr:hypothetical protein CXG81DRAFT_28351 [Caulochytrium protostelioides]|eukprot:RKO98860.1 hypothetical protein CXG81DRAFT_28351 [Caulochytrium protostelioides]
MAVRASTSASAPAPATGDAQPRASLDRPGAALLPHTVTLAHLGLEGQIAFALDAYVPLLFKDRAARRAAMRMEKLDGHLDRWQRRVARRGLDRDVGSATASRDGDLLGLLETEAAAAAAAAAVASGDGIAPLLAPAAPTATEAPAAAPVMPKRRPRRPSDATFLEARAQAAMDRKQLAALAATLTLQAVCRSLAVRQRLLELAPFHASLGRSVAGHSDRHGFIPATAAAAYNLRQMEAAQLQQDAEGAAEGRSSTASANAQEPVQFAISCYNPDGLGELDDATQERQERLRCKYQAYLAMRERQAGRPLPITFMDYAATLFQAAWRMYSIHEIMRRLAGMNEAERAGEVGEASKKELWQKMHRNDYKHIIRPDAARRIQRTWRCHRDRRLFHQFQDLLRFKDEGYPEQLLKLINPKEAPFMDKAAHVRLRFRLGGLSWPPMILYKIYVERNLVDMNRFSPRDYHAETTDPAAMAQLPAPSAIAEGARRRPAANWYIRVDNNGWRPVDYHASAIAQVPEYMAKPQRPIFTEKQRQARMREAKQRKIAFMAKLYAGGASPSGKTATAAGQMATPAALAGLDDLDDLDGLVEWTESLDLTFIENYHADWLRAATSQGSEAGVATVYPASREADAALKQTCAPWAAKDDRTAHHAAGGMAASVAPHAQAAGSSSTATATATATTPPHAKSGGSRVRFPDTLPTRRADALVSAGISPLLSPALGAQEAFSGFEEADGMDAALASMRAKGTPPVPPLPPKTASAATSRSGSASQLAARPRSGAPAVFSSLFLSPS